MLIRVKLHVCGTPLSRVVGGFCLVLRVLFPSLFFLLSSLVYLLEPLDQSLFPSSISHHRVQNRIFLLLNLYTRSYCFFLNLHFPFHLLVDTIVSLTTPVLVTMLSKAVLVSLSVSALFATGAIAALDPIVIKVTFLRD